MSEQTPNAGEKCPVCYGERVIIMERICLRCQGSSLKPAVESPAADVKERDAYAKMFAEHTKEIATLRAENQGLEAIIKSKQTSITDLASHVRSQAKEVEELIKKWNKDENQYRAQVKEAISVNTPYSGMLAHATQLQECAKALKLALKPTPEESEDKPTNS